jgi:hypothetical protein
VLTVIASGLCSLLRTGSLQTLESKGNFGCRSCMSSNQNGVPCDFSLVTDGRVQKKRQVKV